METEADRTGRGKSLVLALLIVLAGYHTLLLGKGALAWPDEHLYLRSIDTASALRRGDFRAAAAALAAWGSRPAEYLLRLPAAATQLAFQRSTGLTPVSPASLPIAAAQNVLVVFLLGLVFFKLSAKLLPSDGAVLATVAFSLLSASHMWIRHLVPYDAALLVHLVALGLALRIPDEPPSRGFPRRLAAGGLILGFLLLVYPLAFYRRRELGLPIAAAILTGLIVFILWLRRSEPSASFRRSVATGLASGIALAIYPAYYSFVPALFLFILLGGRQERVLSLSLPAVRNAAVFGCAVLVVVFGFEVMARIGGVSYLGGARLLASTINQGSFDEGFVFLGTWLWAVDRYAAAWLLPGALVGFLVILESTRKRRLTLMDARLARISLILGAFYLIYGFQSVVMHKMVFTGRYARIYVPVLVWLAALGVSSIQRSRLRLAAFSIAGTLSVVAFLRFAVAFEQVNYPADVLYRLGIGYEDLQADHIRHEFVYLASRDLPTKALTAGRDLITHPGDNRFFIQNFAIPDVSGSTISHFEPRPPGSLISEDLHFCSFLPNAWEGPSRQAREELIGKRFQLRVYRQEP
jgi:hypothetical protein